MPRRKFLEVAPVEVIALDGICPSICRSSPQGRPQSSTADFGRSRPRTLEVGVVRPPHDASVPIRDALRLLFRHETSAYIAIGSEVLARLPG